MRAAGTGPGAYLEAGDGVRLHYRQWVGDEPRAALLVVHGLFEHSRRYEELGRAMAAAGIATFALDHRGHGASGGRRGHVRRFPRFLDDVERFRREVRTTLVDGLPVFLLAHSMGGLIGLRYLETYDPPLAGAVITSPWLGTAVAVPGWQRLLAAVLDRVLPVLPFPSGIEPDVLSHDPERVKDYRDDPLIYSTLTPRLWREVGKAGPLVFRDADRIEVPLLMLLAGDDRVVDTARSVALGRALKGPDVTVRVLDGYYHEVLQETDRTAVMADIREWIEDRIP